MAETALSCAESILYDSEKVLDIFPSKIYHKTRWQGKSGETTKRLISMILLAAMLSGCTASGEQDFTNKLPTAPQDSASSISSIMEASGTDEPTPNPGKSQSSEADSDKIQVHPYLAG